MLEPAKRGLLLLFGRDRIDDKVKQYLLKLRECGGVVNSTVTIASANGIIVTMNRHSSQ